MKRTYRRVGVVEVESGYAVTLDDRPVRSPGSRALALPTRPLADRVATEWEAQTDVVDPRAMPMMSLAATAVDRVTPQRSYVVATITGYAGSDLLCHRAGEPEELVRRQRHAWQPLLDWCADAFDAPLAVTVGIMPLSQPATSIARIRRAVDRYDDLALAALHEITAGCGSVVIALAITEGRISADHGVDAAFLDETYQIERWGEDAEAARRRADLRRDILAAAEFLRLGRAWN